MNANEMIFALALASNLNAQENLTWALSHLRHYGVLELSEVFQIPCRDGVGEDYLNCACLLSSNMSLTELSERIKALEADSGRVRPSHQISLDIDLIAWKSVKDQEVEWHFNHKKMPFALDVKIPLSALIQHPTLIFDGEVRYKKVVLPFNKAI